jgi:hypothetical protein
MAAKGSTPPSTQTSPATPPSTSEQVKKKTLRAGRKKVNISASGDIVPIVQSQSSSTTLPNGTGDESPEFVPNQSSTVKTLDQIMLELEKKEAEALERQATDASLAMESEKNKQQKKEQSEERRGRGNRFFCCFQKNEATGPPVATTGTAGSATVR